MPSGSRPRHRPALALAGPRPGARSGAAQAGLRMRASRRSRPSRATSPRTRASTRPRCKGTRRAGRVTKDDVLTVVEGGAAAHRPRPRRRSPPPRRPARVAARPSAREERVKMTPLRRRVAERLLAAQSNAAILTTFNEVDMGAVMALRKQLRGEVPDPARREAGLHELLRPRGGRGAQGLPAGQRGDRRARTSSSSTTTTSAWRSPAAAGWWCRCCATRTR